MTIYQRIGGAAAIEAAVEDFYERVMADDELAPYFDNTHFLRLKAHQRNFLGAALGGPEEYSGLEMSVAHSSLGVTTAHFDKVVSHLAASLEALNVDPKTIDEVKAKLAPLKPLIVGE